MVSPTRHRDPRRCAVRWWGPARSDCRARTCPPVTGTAQVVSASPPVERKSKVWEVQARGGAAVGADAVARRPVRQLDGPVVCEVAQASPDAPLGPQGAAVVDPVGLPAAVPERQVEHPGPPEEVEATLLGVSDLDRVQPVPVEPVPQLGDRPFGGVVPPCGVHADGAAPRIEARAGRAHKGGRQQLKPSAAREGVVKRKAVRPEVDAVGGQAARAPAVGPPVLPKVVEKGPRLLGEHHLHAHVGAPAREGVGAHAAVQRRRVRQGAQRFRAGPGRVGRTAGPGGVGRGAPERVRRGGLGRVRLCPCAPDRHQRGPQRHAHDENGAERQAQNQAEGGRHGRYRSGSKPRGPGAGHSSGNRPKSRLSIWFSTIRRSSSSPTKSSSSTSMMSLGPRS